MYQFLQQVIGADSSRKKIVCDYVRPRAGDRLLDIGCGPGTMVPYLPEVQYFGFDSDAEYIRAAQARFGENRTFSCARVAGYTLEEQQRSSFELALAFGVLHHIDDSEALQLFQLAHSALKPGGRLVTIDGAYDEAQSRWARRVLSWDRGQYIRNRQGYLQLASQVFSSISASTHHHLLRIPYTLIILECVRV